MVRSLADPRLVYEDNIQEVQRKRVEQEMHEDPTPVTPEGKPSIDKEDATLHFETAKEK